MPTQLLRRTVGDHALKRLLQHIETLDDINFNVQRPERSIGKFYFWATLEQRDGGQTRTVVVDQLGAGLEGLAAGDLESLIVAYEPVWAIGTGRTATPGQAGEVHQQIREWLADRFSNSFAESVRIQYGGSVKPENAAELLGMDGVDGALVGGASLEAGPFLAIARAGVAPR